MAHRSKRSREALRPHSAELHNLGADERACSSMSGAGACLKPTLRVRRQAARAPVQCTSDTEATHSSAASEDKDEADAKQRKKRRINLEAVRRRRSRRAKLVEDLQAQASALESEFEALRGRLGELAQQCAAIDAENTAFERWLDLREAHALRVQNGFAAEDATAQSGAMAEAYRLLASRMDAGPSPLELGLLQRCHPTIATPASAQLQQQNGQDATCLAAPSAPQAAPDASTSADASATTMPVAEATVAVPQFSIAVAVADGFQLGTQVAVCAADSHAAEPPCSIATGAVALELWSQPRQDVPAPRVQMGSGDDLQVDPSFPVSSLQPPTPLLLHPPQTAFSGAQVVTASAAGPPSFAGASLRHHSRRRQAKTQVLEWAPLGPLGRLIPHASL